MVKIQILVLLLFVLVVSCTRETYAQTTGFTYQGKLADNGNPANGQYDFQFKLYDTQSVGTGTQQGGDVVVSNLTVSAGIFTAQLDFGVCPTCFNGPARFIEIAVKQTSGSTFTTLGPRQAVTSNPYAIRSLNAVTADGLSVTCVNCVTSSQIQSVQGSQVTGTISVASVPPGSANYIQNGTSQQATSNFNISGDGTANGTLSGNIVNATTQYNIVGNRVLSVTGAGSFVNSNSLVGAGAGASITPSGTGFNGNLNTLFGYNAGANITTGCCNSFMGNYVGVSNTTGRSNVFIGGSTGQGNTQGSFNAFFGDGAGYDFFTNTGNTTGSQNTFIGYLSGRGIIAGSNNTFLGSSTTGTSSLDHATVIGADATVSTNNTVVLGRSVDTVRIPGTLAVTNTVDSTQFNIGGSRVLSSPGTSNLFAGINAGASNTAGDSNSFFGAGAGTANTSGFVNAFFGTDAGRSNTTGRGNSFFGAEAGYSNSTANLNSFFGVQAGLHNTTGDVNSFFGYHAGAGNTTGTANSFFGKEAGLQNTTASGNAFFGASAGIENTTGSGNAFFGRSAGALNTTAGNNSFFGFQSGYSNSTAGNNSFFGTDAGNQNTTGSNNTFVGQRAGFSNTTEGSNTFIGTNTTGSAGSTNATAIGANASVTQSNSLVLGSINAVNSATADTNVGIGTTAPNARFHIAVNSGNTLFGDAGCPAGYTAIGFGSSLSGCTNYSLSGNGTNTIINRPAGGQIIFREDNTEQITVFAGGAVRFGAIVAINTLNSTGATTSLCRTNTAPFLISACTSSLRYKTNIAPFASGLNLIDRLHPITFNWKDGGMKDLGLGAEDVEKVDPLLVTYNDKGEVEGVKYERIGVVLINAVKEQQAQIERQETLIETQQKQIEALKKLVCSTNASADICKEKQQLASLKRVVCKSLSNAKSCQ